MGRSRVVGPETELVTISNGDTITIKKRLNNGEQQAAFSRRLTMLPDGRYVVDTVKAGDSSWLIVAYLVDWSLVDQAGSLIPIYGKDPATVERALNLLDPESVAEIADVVIAHDDAIRAAADQEKKLRSTSRGSVTTSPSLAAVDGHSITSEDLDQPTSSS